MKMTMLFYWRRFTEIVGAVCLAAAGETVKFRVTGYPGNLIMHSIAAQHTEMSVMISTTSAFILIFHVYAPFVIAI